MTSRRVGSSSSSSSGWSDSDSVCSFWNESVKQSHGCVRRKVHNVPQLRLARRPCDRHPAREALGLVRSRFAVGSALCGLGSCPANKRQVGAQRACRAMSCCVTRARGGVVGTGEAQLEHFGRHCKRAWKKTICGLEECCEFGLRSHGLSRACDPQACAPAENSAQMCECARVTECCVTICAKRCLSVARAPSAHKEKTGAWAKSADHSRGVP